MYDGNVVITNIGLDYSTLLLFLLDFQQSIISKTVLLNVWTSILIYYNMATSKRREVFDNK